LSSTSCHRWPHYRFLRADATTQEHVHLASQSRQSPAGTGKSASARVSPACYAATSISRSRRSPLPRRRWSTAMLLIHHHHASAPVSAAPLPLSPALLKRSVSGAFSKHATAGDTASMALGDILQRSAVMCQSTQIRASMEATWHRIDTLERNWASSPASAAPKRRRRTHTWPRA
jgi:hypothetical protein